MTTFELAERRITQIRAMTFARMQNAHALLTGGCEQVLTGLDGGTQMADIIAEHLAKSPRLQKITLHVDQQQGGSGHFKRNGIGLRLS
jgi:hypothetical protein